MGMMLARHRMKKKEAELSEKQKANAEKKSKVSNKKAPANKIEKPEPKKVEDVADGQAKA